MIVLKEENDFYDLSILNKNRILFLDIKSIYSLLMGLKKSILFIFKNNINILHSWLPHSDIFASFIACSTGVLHLSISEAANSSNFARVKFKSKCFGPSGVAVIKGKFISL